VVNFEGENISLFQFKCLVVQKRQLEKGLDFDLQVIDAVSGTDYQGECFLPKNASVVLRKIAPNTNGILARLNDQKKGLNIPNAQISLNFKEPKLSPVGENVQPATQFEAVDSSSGCQEERDLQDTNESLGVIRSGYTSTTGLFDNLPFHLSAEKTTTALERTAGTMTHEAFGSVSPPQKLAKTIENFRSPADFFGPDLYSAEAMENTETGASLKGLVTSGVEHYHKGVPSGLPFFSV